MPMTKKLTTEEVNLDVTYHGTNDASAEVSKRSQNN